MELAPPNEILIQRGDEVQISVLGEADLLTVQRIDPSGQIRLPLLGSVSLVNLTQRQAESYLEGLFVEREFLRYPQVSVRIVAFAERVYSIFGQVQAPGRKTFPPGANALRLVDVIAESGGFTPIARSTAVRVSRIDPKTSEEVSFVINVERMITGRGSSEIEDFKVLPGDIIFIPERLF
ncbi:MAG: polysaccharide biosynthesis/export family protein [Opitutales bacterium]|nr:polysaccharide biosynthesis/export family protein [Opitutales bacterium]